MNRRSKEREESIYNLIPRTPEKVVKPERHQSKFKSTVKDEQKTNKTGIYLIFTGYNLVGSYMYLLIARYI